MASLPSPPPAVPPRTWMGWPEPSHPRGVPQRRFEGIPVPGGLARFRGTVSRINRLLAEEGPFFEGLPEEFGGRTGFRDRGRALTMRGPGPQRSRRDPGGKTP